LPQTSNTHEVCPKPPTPTLPPAGQTLLDPTFGTEILRVTDRNNGAGENYHCYSFWNPFNADNSRFIIKLGGQGAHLFSFDPVNFTSEKIGLLWNGINMQWCGASWSHSEPDILYGIPYSGQKLYQYNVKTRTYTVIKDFTGLLPAGNLSYLTKSSDDRRFAFIVGDQDNNNGVVAVYDKLTDTIYRHDFNTTDIHSAPMDKSGKYVWVHIGISSSSDRYLWNIIDDTVEALPADSIVRARGHYALGNQTERPSKLDTYFRWWWRDAFVYKQL
jgi:hypothetical protein